MKKTTYFKVTAPVWCSSEDNIVESVRGTFSTYMNAELFAKAYEDFYNTKVRIVQITAEEVKL